MANRRKGQSNIIFMSQIFVLFALCGICSAENVLVFVPTPFRSHVIGFEPLLLSLASKGHNITVVTVFPITNNPDNYHQIVIENVPLHFDFKDVQKIRYKFVTLPIIMWSVGLNLTETILKLPKIQSFIHSDDYSFDLVLVDMFFKEAFVAIGHKFGAPIVALSPILLASSDKWTGSPINPSYLPDLRLGYVGRMTFSERLTTSIAVFIQACLDNIFYLPKQEALMNKYFNYSDYSRRPSLVNLLKNISLSLVYYDSVLFHQRPSTLTSVEISGVHARGQKLPEDLLALMNNASHGFVYFSLGSIIDLSNCPEERILTLLDAFGKLPQIVLLKTKFKKHISVPKNVIVMKWFPQLEILAHPNCKLFITHGGVHSLVETVHFGVPILGLPFFVDQETNVKHACIGGYAIREDFQRFTVDSMIGNIDQLINDPRYKIAAKRMSLLYHDKPITPLEMSVYWIEYVMRHKGAYHLRPASHDLEWYQFYLLDVIAFIFICVLSLIIISFYLCKLICNRLKYLFTNKPKQS